MTARTTDLTKLTDRELQRRIDIARRNLFRLRTEEDRRWDMRRSGGRPERLKLFAANITATFWVQMSALSAKDAERIIRNAVEGKYDKTIGGYGLDWLEGFAMDAIEFDISDVKTWEAV
jgi:hypothetical protein